MASDRTRRRHRRPMLPLEYRSAWTSDDYNLLAQFIVGASGCKPRRRHWDMVQLLSMTLQQLDSMRDSHEERLSFFIGNRLCKLGDWSAEG